MAIYRAAALTVRARSPNQIFLFLPHKKAAAQPGGFFIAEKGYYLFYLQILFAKRAALKVASRPSTF